MAKILFALFDVVIIPSINKNDSKNLDKSKIYDELKNNLDVLDDIDENISNKFKSMIY